MTLTDIKMALIDDAVVQVVEIDYFDTYKIGTSADGTLLVAYRNDTSYSFSDMFADIERALSHRGVRVFRRDFTDRTLITIIIGIGEEVMA